VTFTATRDRAKPDFTDFRGLHSSVGPKTPFADPYKQNHSYQLWKHPLCMSNTSSPKSRNRQPNSVPPLDSTRVLLSDHKENFRPARPHQREGSRGLYRVPNYNSA